MMALGLLRIRGRRLMVAPMSLLLFCSTLVARAQTSEGPAPSAPARNRRVLTLIDARRLAFERNWDLLAARSDVDLATAQKIVAREFPNPTLALSSTKIEVDKHPASTSGRNDLWSRNYDTVAAINQLFEVGGKGMRRVAADIENRGKRGRGLLRQIEVSGHVKPGPALKDDLFDPVFRTVERPPDLRPERRALGQRIEAEHVKDLAPERRTTFLPLLQTLHVG